MSCCKNAGIVLQEFVEEVVEPKVQELIQATCSCGSGIPLQDMVVNGKTVTLIALPLIFQQFREFGKPPRRRSSGNCWKP